MQRLYWLDLFGKGNIAMAAHPKGNDWLERDIKSLIAQNISVVVSLLEKSEANALGLSQAETFCKKYALEFINFPIKDRQVPESKLQFLSLVETLQTYLENDKKMLIHCRMGIGRTSLVCAGILIRQGIPPKEVFEILTQKRQLEVPDTEAQKEWIFNTY